MIKTKSVYSPASGGDGKRVLVSRYWPRGVKKEAVDRWIKGLGPSPALIKAWKTGAITWPEFGRRYARERGSEEWKTAFEELKAFLSALKGKDATLLCTCREGENHCHREIIKELLGAGGK
ncbi:MAG TPA: DUF488 family protein [Thermodesulfobacteriota bacterium]|nr:DUF488 family protein [Thermodesulfobacteriota bacterium]